MNFGFASLIAATVALYHPDWTPESWQLLLIFYAICLLTFVIVAYGNKLLPMVDTICAAFTAISILITLICLSAKASVGRHSARDTLVRRVLSYSEALGEANRPAGVLRYFSLRLGRIFILHRHAPCGIYVSILYVTRKNLGNILTNV